MTMFRVGPAGIPALLKTEMNSVLNKKFGTTGQNYPPKQWPDDVNLLGPLPIKNASGVIASFSDGADDVPISEGLFSWTPKQTGSGTPSPTNVRPLSAYSGMTIYQTGKNMLDFNSNIRTTSSGGLNFEVKTDGGIRCYGTTNRTYAYITNTMNVWIPAGASLIFSRTDNPSFGLLLNCTFADGSGSGSVIIAADNYTKTWVVSKNVSQIRLELASLTNETAYDFTVYPMLEVGSTRTTWELYKSKTPIVDDFGRTIYGGSRSTDGDLNETFVKMILDGSEEWNKTNAGPYYITLPGYHKEQGFTNGACSHFQMVPEVGLASNLTTDLTCSFYFGADQNRFYIRYDAMATKEDLQTWLSNNNVEVVYKIATPNEYTLDPISISSYLGSNNIYTDQETGECSIDYRADINLLLNS